MKATLKTFVPQVAKVGAYICLPPERNAFLWILGVCGQQNLGFCITLCGYHIKLKITLLFAIATLDGL